VDNRYDHLLVVGHNPGMGDLAMRLSDGAITAFPTAAFAAFSAGVDDWQSFNPGHLKLTASFAP
jgi:phosphohistidine phosphatase SixA